MKKQNVGIGNNFKDIEKIDQVLMSLYDFVKNTTLSFVNSFEDSIDDVRKMAHEEVKIRLNKSGLLTKETTAVEDLDHFFMKVLAERILGIFISSFTMYQDSCLEVINAWGSLNLGDESENDTEPMTH